MAVRSSSWSKHVHRHTVQQPTDNDCNACQYNTDVGGQDCKVTTHHRDTDSSTFGSHIHRGIGACCQGTARDRHGCENMLKHAHALVEGMHQHHYHQQTTSTSHCNRKAHFHSSEGCPRYLTCHSHTHVQQHRHHHHHHHQQLTHSTHYDGARETSQSCTCSHSYGSETRAHSGGYRGCRGLTQVCLCRRPYGPPLPGGLMCVGRGRVGCVCRR